MSLFITLFILNVFNPLLVQCIYTGDQSLKKPPLHREPVIDNWFYRERSNSDPTRQTSTDRSRQRPGLTINQGHSRIEVTTPKSEDFFIFPSESKSSTDTSDLNLENVSAIDRSNVNANIIDDSDRIVFPDPVRTLYNIISDYINNQSESVISKESTQSDTKASDNNVKLIQNNSQNFNYGNVISTEANLENSKSELSVNKNHGYSQQSHVMKELRKANTVTHFFEILKTFIHPKIDDRIIFQDSSENYNPHEYEVTEKVIDNFSKDDLFIFSRILTQNLTKNNLDINEDLKQINEVIDHNLLLSRPDDETDKNRPQIEAPIVFNDEYEDTIDLSNQFFQMFTEKHSILPSDISTESIINHLDNFDVFSTTEKLYELLNESDFAFTNSKEDTSTVIANPNYVANYQNSDSSINNTDYENPINNTNFEPDIDDISSNETITELDNLSIEIIDGREKEVYQEGKSLYERCDNPEYPISPHERSQRRPCKRKIDTNVFSEEDTDFSYNDEHHIPIQANISKDVKLMNYSDRERDTEIEIINEKSCPESWTGLLAIPSDCRKFVNCWKGVGYIMTCGTGTLYNSAKQICDHAKDVDCQVEKIDERAERIPESDNINSNNILEHMSDTNIIPSTKHASKLSLPNEVHNKSMLQDGRPSLPMMGTARQAKYIPPYRAESTLQNIDKEVYIGDECPPGATGQFVYAYDCRQFLNCWNGRGYIQPCALGTLFNPETLECDHAHKVDCLHSDFSIGGFGNTRQEQLSAPRRNDMNSKNVEPKCESGASGIFPHPGDCSKFLNCAHGRTYIQQCGPGTAFNPLIKVCDYAHNVGCDIAQEGNRNDYDVISNTDPPMRYHVSDRRPGRPGKNLMFGSYNPQFITSNQLRPDSQIYGESSVRFPQRPVNNAHGYNPAYQPNLHGQHEPSSQLVPPPLMPHHQHHGPIHNHGGSSHHRGHDEHRGHEQPHSEHNHHGQQPQYNIRGNHQPASYDHHNHHDGNHPHHNNRGGQQPNIHENINYGQPEYNRGNQQPTTFDQYGGHHQHSNRDFERPTVHDHHGQPQYNIKGNQQPTSYGQNNHGVNQQHHNIAHHQPNIPTGFQHNHAPSSDNDQYVPAESNTYNIHRRPPGQNNFNIPPEHKNTPHSPQINTTNTYNRTQIHRQNTTTPNYIHRIEPKINVQGYRQNATYNNQSRPSNNSWSSANIRPIYDGVRVAPEVKPKPNYNPWQPSVNIPIKSRTGNSSTNRTTYNGPYPINCIPDTTVNNRDYPGSRITKQNSSNSIGRPPIRSESNFNTIPSHNTMHESRTNPVYCNDTNSALNENTRYASTVPSTRTATNIVGPIPTKSTQPSRYDRVYQQSTTPMTPSATIVITPPTYHWNSATSTTTRPVTAAYSQSNIMKIPPRNAKSNPLRPEVSETLGKVIEMMYFGRRGMDDTNSTIDINDEFEEFELINNNRQVKKAKSTPPLSVLPLDHSSHFIEKAPSDCAAGHFRCDDTRCITLSKICNKVQDCKDGTDEEQCEERIGYEIRLAGSTKSNEGRVEVKAFGVWGRICDDRFGLRDADVICKELGFKLGAAQAHFPTPLNTSQPVVFLMDDLDCLGNETSLRECQFNGWGVHDCLPEEAAGVVCRTPAVTCPKDFWLCSTSDECIPTSFLCDGVQDCGDGSDESDQICNGDIELRLSNGPSKLEGRVEVKFRGIWGTVCDDDFTDKAAQVVCRMLGYEGPAKAKKEGAYGAGAGQIWLDQVACFGNETSLAQCLHWQWGENNCGHSEDVGVVCSNATIGTNKQEHGRGLSLDDSTIDFVDDNFLQSGTSRELMPVECGVRSNIDQMPVDDDVAFRVVRGSLAKIGDYPWQASLRVRGAAQSAHWCGAVLISRLHLLTAAHCLVAFSKGAYFIRVGDHDAVEMEVYIEEFYVHEEFRQGQHMNNDIALIKLKSGGVPLGKWIKPICLPPKEVDYTPGKNCTISGWGSIQTGKSSPSNQLRAGWVPIQPMDVCRMPQVYGAAITEGMVCAGELDEGVDACDGDSGGPLACLHDGVFTLFGITSWGQHCGHANKPGVYVKVSHYRDWIEDKIKLSMTEQ